MTDKKPEITPNSYAETLKRASHKIELEAGSIKHSGYGGILNLVAEDGDLQEAEHLTKLFAQKLGISGKNIINIDLESLVAAIELRINKEKLEILENHLDNQTLEENVFQYVYKTFGRGGGWRIGKMASYDSISSSLIKETSTLDNTPFATFLDSLDLNLERSPEPKLIVVHFPKLDSNNPIRKPEDAHLENLSQKQRKTVEKYLHIFSLLTQVYPSKFQSDNPTQNVVLNVVDTSYSWFLARNTKWFYAYDNLKSYKVEAPSAVEKDEKILNSKNS